MATQALVSRISVVETQVDNVEEKIEDLKADVKDLHECLDRTHDSIMVKLTEMHKENITQHSELSNKVKELEQFKTKWVYLSAGALVAVSLVTGHSEKLLGFFK